MKQFIQNYFIYKYRGKGEKQIREFKDISLYLILELFENELYMCMIKLNFESKF